MIEQTPREAYDSQRVEFTHFRLTPLRSLHTLPSGSISGVFIFPPGLGVGYGLLSSYGSLFILGTDRFLDLSAPQPMGESHGEEGSDDGPGRVCT